jgi:predicted dehydrogenase
MRQIHVVMIGLGRMGGRFFDKLIEVGDERVKVLAVCELNDDNPYLDKARDMGIARFVDFAEAIEAYGEEIDIILDTSNVPATKQAIRKLLQDQNNQHTVLVPLVVDYLMWYLLPGDEPIPQDHVEIGY